MDSDRIAGEAKKMGGKLKEGLGDVAGDPKLEAEGLVDQAKGAVQNAYGRAKDTARDVVGDVDEYVDRARDIAGTALDRGRRYVDDGLDRLPDTRQAFDDGREVVARRVQEAPLAALLIAGAIGYGLAVLLHRSVAPPPPPRSRGGRARNRGD